MPSNTLVAASTKPVILGLLLTGETYGYQILQRVRQLSGGSLKWSSAMLYPVLRRMEKDGLIRSDWRLSPENRMRKYYKLTELGRKEFEVEKAHWLDIQNALSRIWKMAEASE